ncbi:hypothetical protein R1sor_003143 [Riccia sorocarpa]|uniref:AB hydrolase-1 domain-containing protein n=1 Tax=Riccia sorocarpa TaxID=122646 RepID=A0ABD3H4W6_9MARC
MGKCLPFSGVKWILKFLEMHYRALGMEPKMIEIDGGQTVMNCWVPVETSKPAQESTPPKPALVLLHGFGLSGFFGWESQTHAFVKDFRVYVPDLVFFGKSYTNSSERSEIFQAECVKKMLDVLKVDQCHLMGTSYGGMVAFRIASLYPEMVNKVVLASSGIMMDHTTNNKLLEHLKADDIKEILVPKDVAHLKLGLSTATTKKIWAIPSFILRDLYEKFYLDNQKEKEELVDGTVIGSVDAPPLPKITQEVLILWGSKDKIFDPELAVQLKTYIGDKAELHMIEGCGHVPQIEKPREFNQQVLQFLR